MSHIVTVQTEVRDAGALRAACDRLGLPAPVHGSTRLYSGEVTGLIVQLPGWHYPVVCQTESGKIQYDNFGGHWGDQKELNRLMQAYAVEMAKIEARKRGHSVSEQALADGSIKLTVQGGRCRMKLIEIIIAPNGQTRVETKGFAGAECRQASEYIETALGRKSGEQLTGEFYQTQANQQTVQSQS